MASDASVSFLYKKYYLLMNNEIVSSRHQKSLSLWFQNPMANKALAISRTPSIAATDARNFLQIKPKLCDPITEYNENLINCRPQTEWAMYGHPMITHRRNIPSSNKSLPLPIDPPKSISSHRESNSLVSSNTTIGPNINNGSYSPQTGLSKGSSKSISTDMDDTNTTSSDDNTSQTIESDTSSMYNINEIQKITLSNPVIGSDGDQANILTKKPFELWNSNVTVLGINAVDNVKIAMKQIYNAAINDYCSLDSVTNINSVTSSNTSYL